MGACTSTFEMTPLMPEISSRWKGPLCTAINLELLLADPSDGTRTHFFVP